MINEFSLSDQLIQWIALAGNRVIQGKEGAWMITDGEVHHQLHLTDGVYRITRSSRSNARQFVVESSILNEIEVYLTCLYGTGLRSMRKLPIILGSTKTEDMKPGWVVERIPSKDLLLQDPSGNVRGPYDQLVHTTLKPGWSVVIAPYKDWLLMDADGTRRAVFSGNEAVGHSWVADEPMDRIRDSFLNPEGLPLFPGGWIGPPGKRPDYLTRKWDEYHNRNIN